MESLDACKRAENVTAKDVSKRGEQPRTGKDYRGGKDVTPGQFSATFGFRGVEFGNWVRAGGKITKSVKGC
jgi:hypothetical protein